MRIPGDEKGIVKLAQELIEQCGVSMGSRGAAYKQYSQYIETGRDSGTLSLGNKLYAHVDRLASHLFCPTEARFTIDFDNVYPEKILKQAAHASRTVTRAFSRFNFDTSFSGAVSQSLGMGASFIKIVGKAEDITINDKSFSHIKDATARIVPPWLMGVENESKNAMTDQEAILEKCYLNKYDVWRRISHFPDADKLYQRILGHGSKTNGPALPSGFVQVLSTSQLSLSPSAANPPNAGGIVQITGDPAFATVGPQMLAEQFPLHEIWVWDDARTDWLMIQLIEPDVLIAPRYKRVNEFCPGQFPYIKVQPNEVPGYFWGRSEIIDLLGLQTALSDSLDDFKRLIGVQYDKRLGFEGFDGDPAELYDDFRTAGYVNGRAGSKVNDLTPELPPGALEYIRLILTMMEDVGGFGNILSGQGEAGVRAGNHAETLVKTASPRLRDRSLIVERNYAQVADTYLSYMEAKDGTQYYYDPKDVENSSYLLSQLPDDRRVMVDSHSSSPIYQNDHNQLTAFGLNAGLVDGGDAIDMLNFPNSDELRRKWEAKQAAQQEQIAKAVAMDPTLLVKMMGGGKRK